MTTFKQARRTIRALGFHVRKDDFGLISIAGPGGTFDTDEPADAVAMAQKMAAAQDANTAIRAFDWNAYRYGH